MQKVLFLFILSLSLSACSADIFWSNTAKTKNFFSENLIFTKPVNEFEHKRPLTANNYTIQIAKQKKQQISYDPYYPMTKPWNEKPEATHLFPETR